MARMHRHDGGLPGEQLINAGQRVAGDGFAADKVGPALPVTSIHAAAATVRYDAPSRGHAAEDGEWMVLLATEPTHFAAIGL